MIDSIEGEIAEIAENYVVLETNGIGYKIFASRATREDLTGIEGPVQLFTHLHVREDALELYGFSTPEERKLFRLLLPISGIGPKVALQILSAMTPGRFREAIIRERPETLLTIKGIGKKTAERLILELKEKLPKIPLGKEPVTIFSDREELAFRALTRSLGFGEREARRAIEKAKAEEDLPTEELIKRALEVIRA